MHPAQHLIELVRQVRPLTLKWVAKPEDRHLLWSPEGLCNHVLWHGGHILWVADSLCVRQLSGESQLPDGWGDIFGMDCDPVAERTDWPDRQQVLDLLEKQQGEMLRLLEDADEAALSRQPSPDAGMTVAGKILHGLHDEAKHQGEIHLLIKQWRAQHDWQPAAS
ncbi:MAG: DinB family protein [Phycisphaeraceae bacterium]